MDWSGIFGIEMSPFELMIRGTVVYWFLFLVFRFVLRRDAGALGVADMLLIVLVADASSNGMTGEYRSVTEGLILLATIFGWNLLIDYLTFKVPFLSTLTEPRPIPLVRHGRLLHRNLHQQFLTPDAVLSSLREQGIAKIEEVSHAYLEGNGTISVITRGPRRQPRARGGAGREGES